MRLPDNLDNLSYEDLCCFCYDAPGFKSIYSRLTKHTTKDQLLKWIKQHADRTIIHNLPDTPAPAITKTPADAPLPECPYRGLFAFHPQDADVFFGREAFTHQLVQAAESRSFVAVLGASGSGKSSVVFAGLVPALQASGQWRFTFFRPGDDPFQRLTEALVPLYEKDPTKQIINARKLSTHLRQGELPLSRGLPTYV